MLLNRVVLQMRLCRLFAGFSEQDTPRILAGDVHGRVMSVSTLHVSSEKGCMAVCILCQQMSVCGTQGTHYADGTSSCKSTAFGSVLDSGSWCKSAWMTGACTVGVVQEATS